LFAVGTLLDHHVLVNPYNPDLNFITHEFLEGSPDRMWIYDKATGKCGPLEGQPPSEWFMHEFWSRDGKRVVFHGGQVDKRKSMAFAAGARRMARAGRSLNTPLRPGLCTLQPAPRRPNHDYGW
jgi:hypothetical protein